MLLLYNYDFHLRCMSVAGKSDVRGLDGFSSVVIRAHLIQ